MSENLIHRTHPQTDDVHTHPMLDRMEPYYNPNPEGSIPINPFRKSNQNGNYRRGYQNYIRGGFPKGPMRTDEDKVYEFVILATKPREWVAEVLENRGTEWWVKIREENGNAVAIRIPFDESVEITFEWDYEG